MTMLSVRVRPTTKPTGKIRIPAIVLYLVPLIMAGLVTGLLGFVGESRIARDISTVCVLFVFLLSVMVPIGDWLAAQEPHLVCDFCRTATPRSKTTPCVGNRVACSACATGDAHAIPVIVRSVEELVSGPKEAA